MHSAHELSKSRITREPARDDQELTTVTFDDGCTIVFIAHRGARWNGYAKLYRHTPGFLDEQIDAARSLAFPDRR